MSRHTCNFTEYGQGYIVLFSVSSIECDKKTYEFTGVINLFSVVSLSHG